MRLPEFLTELSPIRETLEALEQGETAMADAVAEKNKQVSVASADEGLALWERDYGLPVREGAPLEERRATVRAAMAGGRTLTPAFLKELCVTLGGADRGEVTEDFPNWRVTAEVVTEGRVPGAPAPLERAVEKLKPAHLEVLITPPGRVARRNEAIRRPHWGHDGGDHRRRHPALGLCPVRRPDGGRTGGGMGIKWQGPGASAPGLWQSIEFGDNIQNRGFQSALGVDVIPDTP